MTEQSPEPLPDDQLDPDLADAEPEPEEEPRNAVVEEEE